MRGPDLVGVASHRSCAGPPTRRRCTSPGASRARKRIALRRRARRRRPRKLALGRGRQGRAAGQRPLGHGAPAAARRPTAATSSSTTAPPAARIVVTRTTGAESNAALGAATTRTSPTSATATSSSSRSRPERASLVTQLTDVAAKKAEPRLTDSQKFIRDEEEKLIGFHPRAEGGQAAGRGEGEGDEAAGVRAAGSADAPPT